MNCVRSLSDSPGTAKPPSSPPAAAPMPDEIGTAAALCWYSDRAHWTVARTLGISRRTLTRWKARPDFQAAYTAAMVVWHVVMDTEVARRDEERKGGGPLVASLSATRRALAASCGVAEQGILGMASTCWRGAKGDACGYQIAGVGSSPPRKTRPVS